LQWECDTKRLTRNTGGGLHGTSHYFPAKAAEVDLSMIVPSIPDPAIKVKSVLMGLLVSVGMLIPGNIPNNISANKLGITSKEWVKLGVPLGLVAMLIYFIILYAPNWKLYIVTR
jgi:predicted cation transporter